MQKEHKKHILVTGGTGFIGSHMLVELITAGYRATAVDNLSNSSLESLRRVEKIVGQKIPFHQVDLCDKAALATVFAESTFDAVIHFAALKAVDTSVAQPIHYYQNNLVSTLNLCQLMQEHKVETLVFSSTAAVYAASDEMPITEASPVGPSNPYGRSKAMIEQILQDVVVANPMWRVTLLRYFNPIGAHESGLIGEDPHGPPDNLVPYITQVATGKLPYLRVFGNDYDTPDGTGVRDYIHVIDLVKGHLAALDHPPAAGQAAVYNLGTGQGYSVMEMLHAFEVEVGKPIPHQVMARRPGDIAVCFANPTKAHKELGWKAQKDLTMMCVDAWRWQSQNPFGYHPPQDRRTSTTQ